MLSTSIIPSTVCGQAISSATLESCLCIIPGSQFSSYDILLHSHNDRIKINLVDFGIWLHPPLNAFKHVGMNSPRLSLPYLVW